MGCMVAFAPWLASVIYSNFPMVLLFQNHWIFDVTLASVQCSKAYGTHLGINILADAYGTITFLTYGHLLNLLATSVTLC